MTTFFLDLWHDLREKRLWPVAVGLLAAIVAVPVLIFKPATGAPPVDSATANGASERLPVVNLEDGPTRGSKLDVFDPKDPFRPLVDQPGTPGTGGSDSDSGSSGAGGDAGAGGSASGGSDGGSASGGAGGGGAGGGEGGSGGGGGVQYFTFTVDVKFGKRGREETRRNVKRLELLPSESNPVVVFMGVTNDAKRAVFLLTDPGYESNGEGECHPEESCEFVYLGLDDNEDEHTFATPDGGAEYNLQLLRVNRETISQDEALGDSRPPTSANRAEAKRRRKPRPTAFDVPFLRLRR